MSIFLPERTIFPARQIDTRCRSRTAGSFSASLQTADGIPDRTVFHGTCVGHTNSGRRSKLSKTRRNGAFRCSFCGLTNGHRGTICRSCAISCKFRRRRNSQSVSLCANVLLFENSRTFQRHFTDCGKLPVRHLHEGRVRIRTGILHIFAFFLQTIGSRDFQHRSSREKSQDPAFPNLARFKNGGMDPQIIPYLREGFAKVFRSIRFDLHESGTPIPSVLFFISSRNRRDLKNF